MNATNTTQRYKGWLVYKYESIDGIRYCAQAEGWERDPINASKYKSGGWKSATAAKRHIDAVEAEAER